MLKRISATAAAKKFSDLLDAVEHFHDSFEVERHGRPVARIAPARPTHRPVVWAEVLAALRHGPQT